MSHFSVQMILNDQNYVPIMDETGDLLVDEEEAFILASRAVNAPGAYPKQKWRSWSKVRPKYVNP